MTQVMDPPLHEHTCVGKTQSVDLREAEAKGGNHVCRFKCYGRGRNGEPHFQCVVCGVYMMRGVTYGPD